MLLVGGGLHEAAGDLLRERRPLLDGQSVRREVGDAEPGGAFEVRHPVLGGLVRQAEDEVDGERVEPDAADRVDRRARPRPRRGRGS